MRLFAFIPADIHLTDSKCPKERMKYKNLRVLTVVSRCVEKILQEKRISRHSFEMSLTDHCSEKESKH